jgi:hypothetical protein
LRFFQSLFGSDDTVHKYPESLVHSAIERAVDGTDPWIRSLSGYQKKLRPAALLAIEHVMALVDGLSPAMVVEPGSYDREPLLRTFFISTAVMNKILDSDRNLADFWRRQITPLPRIHALLAMEKQEKPVLGAVMSGDIILRDVRQTAVSLDDHQLIDPAASEDKNRRYLKRRAFDHLLSLALSRITIVKTEHDSLERYRTLLQAKLNLLQREGWGFDKTVTDESQDVAGVEKQLDQIEQQLQELGGDDRMLEVYLDIVIDVLGRPEEHLWLKKEPLIVDRMGIKQSEVSGDASEVTLDVLHNIEGRSLVVALVDLPGEIVFASHS